MRTPEQVLIDPQVGDSASTGSKYRIVVKRDHNDITYITRHGGPERTCFISTWMEWCSRNKATGRTAEERSKQ